MSRRAGLHRVPRRFESTRLVSAGWRLHQAVRTSLQAMFEEADVLRINDGPKQIVHAPTARLREQLHSRGRTARGHEEKEGGGEAEETEQT